MPQPTADEAVITVEAIGINYADVLMRRGDYRRDQRLPLIPGIEVVGRLAHPHGGTPVRRVVAFLENGGGYADLAIVPRHRLWPVTTDLPSSAVAAAFIQGLTASYALQLFGHVEPSDCVPYDQ